MTSQQNPGTFHTDQGKWDQRSFEPDERYFLDPEDESFEVVDDLYEKPVRHVFSDEELERVVKDLLKNSKQLHGDDISVSSHNSDVTLRGTVQSEVEKNVAGSVVQLIHGVGLIHNELVVKLNEGILPSDVGRKG